jgi:uncharacterized protein (DUF305 family)
VTGVAALAAVAAIGACSNAGTKEGTSSTAQSSSAAPAVAHNQADMMFARMMIPHHQQAVQMSDMIFAKQSIDPRVIDLAKQIKAAQGPEIEKMQGWLNQRGMPGMPGMTGMPGMDGMMSPADMHALQNAQGVEASKLFLTQMIKHHQGAITMAQNERKNGQFPDAVALAKSIASSQQKEIDTMNQILSSL